MKKGLLFTASLAMFLGLGVAAGARLGEGRVERASADPVATDYIYLDNSSWYEGNERYAAYFFTDSPAANEWVNFTWDADLYINKVAIPATAYENVILCRMDGATDVNDWSNRWNQTNNLANHTGIYKPFARSAKTVDGAWEYVLTVGETTTYMVPHTSSEVKRTITASAGDLVSLKSDEATAAGTLNPNSKPSNNLNLDKTLKVGGEVEIFVTREGWSTWASGYAPADTKLQDFCDAILQLDCSAKDLGLEDEWADLGETNQAAFNAAQVKLGDGVTPAQFGNVVNEAATRYVLLVNKGATPISGITVHGFAGSTAINPTVTNTSFVVVVIVASTVAVIGAGLFFLLKRKQD